MCRISGDITICSDDTVNISVNEIYMHSPEYTWLPNYGLESPQSFTTVAYPDLTTEYIIEYNDTINCFNSDTMLITVNPSPEVMFNIDSVYKIADSIFLVNNSIANVDGYSWYINSGLFSNEPEPIYVVADTGKI